MQLGSDANTMRGFLQVTELRPSPPMLPQCTSQSAVGEMVLATMKSSRAGNAAGHACSPSRRTHVPAPRSPATSQTATASWKAIGASSATHGEDPTPTGPCHASAEASLIA